MKNLNLFSNETITKNSFYCCFKNFKRNSNIFLVMILFMGSFMQGVSAQGTLVPACNLTGVLVACAVANPADTSGDITITATVARSGSGALLSYSFSSNTSGAIIRLPLAPQVYNAGTNTTTQLASISILPAPSLLPLHYRLLLNQQHLLIFQNLQQMI